MEKLYVLDTTSLISYFDKVFNQPTRISPKAILIIDNIFGRISNDRLSIPSIVFIEIFKKWLKTQEFLNKFYYEVYNRIVDNPNIEIKPIEQEVLENLIKIDSIQVNENHDRLILASAMMLDCPLITSDSRIIEYVKTTNILEIIE